MYYYPVLAVLTECLILSVVEGDMKVAMAKQAADIYGIVLYPYTCPVTYLAITQDKDGNFKFVVAEGVN